MPLDIMRTLWDESDEVISEANSTHSLLSDDNATIEANELQRSLGNETPGNDFNYENEAQKE